MNGSFEKSGSDFCSVLLVCFFFFLNHLKSWRYSGVIKALGQ